MPERLCQSLISALVQLRSPAFWRAVVPVLIAALGAGYLAWLLHIPIPWLIGPILSTLALITLGQPVNTMAGLRTPMVAIIGAMLGASFSSDIFGQIASWWMLFLGLFCASTFSSALAYLILRRLGRLDRATAYFGSTPGGLVEMSVLSESFGGDMRKAFLVHTLRIFLVVLILPQAIHFLFGVTIARSGSTSAAGAMSLLDVALLLACVLAGPPLARRLRLQAPQLLGPMLLSAILHASGLTGFKPPFALLAMAQLFIGIGMGGRFIGVERDSLLRLGWVTLVIVTLHLAVAFGAASVMAHISGRDMVELMLAYAPGGLAEMSIIALAVGGNVALVAVHHLVRVTLVLFIAPPLYRRLFG